MTTQAPEPVGSAGRAQKLTSPSPVLKRCFLGIHAKLLSTWLRLFFRMFVSSFYKIL